jgi:hypothetical protein
MAEYKLTVPIEKSETSDGRWIIKGKAAGINHVDAEKQTLRAPAIERLARRINEQPIPFKDWHAKNTSFSELGVVTSAKVSSDFELDVEVELDKRHPFSQLLWGKMDDGKQYGMSIGGKSEDWKVEEEDGQKVVAVYDVDIEEISLTTKPLWTPSLGTVIRKAIDEEQHSESVEGVETVEVETTTVVADSTPAPEEVTSAPENVTDAETVVVEKAVNADTARERQKVAKLVKYVKGIDNLLTELGLSGDSDQETTPAVETIQVVEKSEDEESDIISLMKSQLQEQKEAIELLKSQIPSTPVPGVLVRQDGDAEAIEVLKSKDIDPRERIRYGLAIMHNEVNKLR